MSGGDGDGVARVPIPGSVLRTIRQIKAITGGKHSDGEIHALLKDCNMDPNETAQKLLYLDTFQEVKRKRRNVSVKNRRKHGGQRQGTRRDNYYTNNSDGGRQLNSHRNNGSNSTIGSASKPSTPDPLEESNEVPTVTSSAVPANDSKNACNGSSSHESTSHSAEHNIRGIIKDTKADHAIMSEKLSSLRPVSVKQLSALDPGPTPTSTPTNPSLVASGARIEGGNLKSKLCNLGNSVGSLSVSDPVLVPSLDPRNPGAVGVIKRVTRSQHSAAEISANAVQNVNIGQAVSGSVDLNKQETCSVRQVNGSSKEMSGSAGLASEDNLRSLLTLDDPCSRQATSEVELKLHKLHISPRKTVIFPDHLHVPEDFSNTIIFGSMDPFLEQNRDSNPTDPSVPSNNEASKEPSPTTQSSSPVSRHGDYPDQPQSPPHVLVNLPSSQENGASASALRHDQSKQETRSHGPLFSPMLEYGPSFIFPAVGQLDEHKQQGGNGTTPSITQPRGTAQSSIAVSAQQLFPYLRQPYPPHYMPYSHYYSQLYMPPQNVHPLSGLPHQPSAGNILMTPTASGAKYPTPAGVSELKEDNMHSTIRQNEELHAMTTSSGRDMSAFQANYFYNLPQGQAIAFPPAQVGHNSFPSIYQSMTQPTGGTTEPVVPPLSSYPQQYGQMSWNQKLLNRDDI